MNSGFGIRHGICREKQKSKVMEKEQLKNPVVLGTVKEGETTLEPISLPHLDEAIDQMEAFVNTEKDKRRKMWAEDILESMRRVCWDLEKYKK